MPPDRFLNDTVAGEAPSQETVQQLIEAEHGKGTQGISRRWLASDSAAVVLTSDTNGVRISRDHGASPPTNVINVGTPAGGGLTGTYPNPMIPTATLDLLAPPGAIIAYAGATVPPGWLFCDGSLQDPATYPRLYAAITTMYGFSGSLFRLPNLQGRVILCASGGHAVTTTGGAEQVDAKTYAEHNHPGSHSHGLNNHTHALTQHQHNVPAHEHTLNGHTHTLSSHTHKYNLTHDHALAPGAAVASGAITGVHEGPSAVVNVAASGHAHDVDLPNHLVTDVETQAPSSPNVNTGGNSGNTSTLAAANVDNNPAGVNTGNATGSTAPDSTAPATDYAGRQIPTLPPYITLNYLIRAV